MKITRRFKNSFYMSYFAYHLKVKIGTLAGVGIICLSGATLAEDIPLVQFNDQSYEVPLVKSSTLKDASTSLSLEVSLENRRPADLGSLYSKSALEDYDFRFRGMTSPEKVDALDVLMAAMDEFEVLHGVKDTFEQTESRLEQYIKKFMLRGEFDFSEIDEKTSSEERSGPSYKKENASSFFYKVFVPDRLKWNIDMSYGGRSVGGELDLGKYLTIRGDVGEDTRAFIVFKLDF